MVCVFFFLPPCQTIGAEIAAHEVTVEDMRRRNVANMPPSTTDGKAARGGTMLDQLQVTVTPTGENYVLHDSVNQKIKIYSTDMFIGFSSESE